VIDELSPGQQDLLESRLRCELSLADYVREAWAVLEPQTPLVWGRVFDVICEELEMVTRGETKRLVINVPPGFMKSLLVNVFWPSWEWGPQGMPALRYITAAYEQGLATRDLVRCRDLVKSEWFQERWPIDFKDDQDQKTYYETTDTGWQFAASVRAALTGYRGDRVKLDDPHSVRGAESAAEMAETRRWFSETLPTRLNHQGRSVMVMIMQRVSVADLSSMAIEQGWRHVCLPMRYEPDHPHRWPHDWRTTEGELLCPERFDEQAVQALEKALSQTGGSYAVAGQLQQRPVPRGGGMFKRDKVTFVDTAPACTRWVRGWDLAATEGAGKATVGLKLGLTSDGRLVIADVVRVQKEPYGVEETIKACARADGMKVAISMPQDPGQAGKSQAARLASLLPGHAAHFSPESGDKVDRAVPCSAQWEAGNVILVRAPWNDRFLGEAELFGPATVASGFTDQIDAFSRAYAYLLLHRSTAQGFGAPPTVA